MSTLFEKGSISNQEYDEVQARLRAAEANHQMAIAKRRQLDAKIAQANEERSSAEIMRGYARLTAPFPGVVTARSVEPGNLAAPGAPLATIEREGAYRLEVPVEESRAGSIRAGHTATIDIEALGRTIQARVSEVVPAVDAASRSYTVKIDLPASPQLRSGMFGRALFAVGARTALIVPAAAVIERGQLQSVMVADNGIAHTRLITTGQRQRDKVEVLSGLVPGEKVIAPVPMNLTDGARVEVRQ
jgi:RND family efflux transporter MFP subunit